MRMRLIDMTIFVLDKVAYAFAYAADLLIQVVGRLYTVKRHYQQQ